MSSSRPASRSSRGKASSRPRSTARPRARRCCPRFTSSTKRAGSSPFARAAPPTSNMPSAATSRAPPRSRARRSSSPASASTPSSSWMPRERSREPRAPPLRRPVGPDRARRRRRPPPGDRLVGLRASPLADRARRGCAARPRRNCRAARARLVARRPHRPRPRALPHDARSADLRRRPRLRELPRRRSRGRPRLGDARGPASDDHARRPHRRQRAVRLDRRPPQSRRPHPRHLASARRTRRLLARRSRRPRGARRVCRVDEAAAAREADRVEPRRRRRPRRAGREVFEAPAQGCASCHPGGHTDGASHDVGSDPFHRPFDTPSLHFVGSTAPYFHDGRYATLDELLRGSDGKMGHTAHLSDEDRRALVAYLETL